MALTCQHWLPDPENPLRRSVPHYTCQALVQGRGRLEGLSSTGMRCRCAAEETLTMKVGCRSLCACRDTGREPEVPVHMLLPS